MKEELVCYPESIAENVKLIKKLNGNVRNGVIRREVKALC